MTRIAVGGFVHETNTFAPTKATYDDFVHGGGWPSMALAATCSRSCEHQCRIGGFSLAPPRPMAGSWCRPFPVARAPRRMSRRTRSKRIVKVLGRRIAAAGPLDAVYLDLHGAMVTEHLDDGEGEILARVRKLIARTSRWSRASTCTPM